MTTQVRPKKWLGQHFLNDLSVAQRIADTVDTAPHLPVLEVGPGMGVLTQFLQRKERPLKVIELDHESIEYLHQHFPQLQVVEGDFLKEDLNELFCGSDFVLTGNYPYNISSQIFFKMLENRDHIPLCTGMIQKEVAERLASPPGSRAYGVLSVFVQVWYDVALLFTVPPGVFSPPPKVQSAVVSLTRNSRTELGCDERLFRRIVKTVFTMRRKMLRNGMRQILGKDHPMLADPFFNQRPEQLSVEDYITLTLRVEQEMAQ